MKINDLISRYDSDNMYDEIKGFPKQFNFASKIIDSWNNKHNYKDINRILILGMGGSAIGGKIISDMLNKSINISIDISSGYSIPKWVNSKTLIIAYSYSGNTEETISSFNECSDDLSRIVISTGGKLLDLANEYNLDYIRLPKGQQPRAALGYSISAYLGLFYKLSLISKEVLIEFNYAITELNIFSKNIISDNMLVKEIAKNIYDKIPIIYSENETTSSIGTRFANQLQENSKILSYSSILPELNHNEIEGWFCHDDVIKKIFIIWLNGFEENIKNIKRRKITFDLISTFTNNQDKIKIDATNKIEYILKLVHFNDWVSFYAAMFNQVNPTPVKQISFLKGKLG